MMDHHACWLTHAPRRPAWPLLFFFFFFLFFCFFLAVNRNHSWPNTTHVPSESPKHQFNAFATHRKHVTVGGTFWLFVSLFVFFVFGLVLFVVVDAAVAALASLGDRHVKDPVLQVSPCIGLVDGHGEGEGPGELAHAPLLVPEAMLRLGFLVVAVARRHRAGNCLFLTTLLGRLGLLVGHGSLVAVAAWLGTFGDGRRLGASFDETGRGRAGGEASLHPAADVYGLRRREVDVDILSVDAW